MEKRIPTRKFIEELDLGSHVVPAKLRNEVIHRWFVFPHSFTNELVFKLASEWNLTEKDLILDPFVGAGTTVLASKELGIPATGYDLSPLSIYISNVKLRKFNYSHITNTWERLRKSLDGPYQKNNKKKYPDLVIKALPGRLLSVFSHISVKIQSFNCSKKEKDFFNLALLSLIPKFSHAVATGGWLKWINRNGDPSDVLNLLDIQIKMMIADIKTKQFMVNNKWHVKKIDARNLPAKDGTFSAVITSPPYPNRHDYTRVFGVELMFNFLTWEETRNLRYQTFHSHPEAKPVRPDSAGYVTPKKLKSARAKLKKAKTDPRIIPMLEGYFLDMYLSLSEVSRVCKPGAKIAYVLGNAQYNGIPISVDEITADIGEQVGLQCDKLVIARYRGNSAQQMKRFGRNKSRETLVIFHKI